MKNGNCCTYKDRHLIRKGDYVNLVARSIISEQSAPSIFRVIKAQNQFGSALPYISLQAVVVVQESSKQSVYHLPENIPHPIVMNLHLVTFNSHQKSTPVFLSFNLMDTLKGQLYNQILNNGTFKKMVVLSGVEKFLRNSDLNPAIDPLLRNNLYDVVDTNRTRDLIFGVFRPHVSYDSFDFPEILEDVSCNIAHILLDYRFQPSEGILSINLEGFKVQAFVEFSILRTRTGGMNAWIPLRIEEIAPVYLNRELKCVAHLIARAGCVQYICTDLYSQFHKPQSLFSIVRPYYLSNYQSALKRLCPSDPVSAGIAVREAVLSRTGMLPSHTMGTSIISTVSQPQSQQLISTQTLFREMQASTVHTPSIGSSSNVSTFVQELPRKENFPINIPTFGQEVSRKENFPINVSTFGQAVPRKETFPILSFTPSETDTSLEKVSVHSSNVSEAYDPEAALDSDNEDPSVECKKVSNSYDGFDEFDRQIMDKKIAKKEEFLQMKRKVRWAKLVLQIEVKKLMQCPDLFVCSVCAFEGGLSAAEKHLKDDIHWDNMHEAYCRELETVKPRTFGNLKRFVDNPKAQPTPINIFDNSSDDENESVPPVLAPENKTSVQLQFTADVNAKKTIMFNIGVKGKTAQTQESSNPTCNMPTPIKAFTNTGMEISTEKINLNADASSVEKQCSFSQPPMLNLDLPEIYIFTETKLKEMGDFQGKSSLLNKVIDCLEGDAQTLIKSEFSNLEKEILKIVNQAHNVCTKINCLEKELQNSRVHYNKWNCKSCEICLQGPEMEKHLKSIEHWTRVINAGIEDRGSIKPYSPDPDTIGDVFGRVSLVLNEVVAIVSFRNDDALFNAVLDISGIDFTSSSTKMKTKSDNMLTMTKKGYPVRMNVCLAWKSSQQLWYYATSAHIGDQADWEDPLPKPDSLSSIKHDEARGPIYNAATSYVKANEEPLMKRLMNSHPEYLANKLVRITFTSEEYCLGTIEDLDSKLFCVFTKQLIKKTKNVEMKTGNLFKVGAMLLDHESRAPYLCHDFHPYPSSKSLETMRHSELKEKQIDAYLSIISSPALHQHLN